MENEAHRKNRKAYILLMKEEITDALAITRVYQTKGDWCSYIHQYVAENKVTYMEAIIEYCNINSIEIESISKLVDDNIKEKIRREAELDNLLKPIGRLDFAS